ncbi:cytochrome P450 [Dacryopinax primogenitus]|uniref:Cytochrome P450 n=1 Tax=Dacryopinax primogenitus (strain DJM 731) TaxID=1858805 RepID=M5GFB8_DACPD|nr:cytochrome P450 [Dacryopinax primogenitus]EJU04023.1 cytochrome P450 [Dacryopinax primogenitus]
MSHWLLSISVAWGILFLVTKLYKDRKYSRLPPLPPGWLVIGNLLDLPLSSLMFKKLTVWSKEFGPIYTSRTLNKRVVVLGNAKVAGEILDRMSSKTGGRPEQIKQSICAEVAILPSCNVTHCGEPCAELHMTRSLLVRLNNTPQYTYPKRVPWSWAFSLTRIFRFVSITHRFSTSAAMRTLYGLEGMSIDDSDPSQKLVEVSDRLFETVKPGKKGSCVTFSQSTIDWRISRKSDAFYQQVTNLYKQCYFSEAPGSCISRDLKEKKYPGLDDVNSVWLVGILLLASQDTTKVALQYFFLAMLLHPEVAREAQKQLDTVIGSRPPTFEDQSNLPYIEAILKEVLRWRPPTPGGLAHMTTDDISYEGYLIPQGTMLIDNIWGMTHDPELYPDPEKFDPSRFLTPENEHRSPSPDTRDDYLTFGHGRRACPGRDLVLRELWIVCTYVLWALEVRKPMDEHGQEITPDPDAFIDIGAVVCPSVMWATAIPRFPNLAELMRLA